MSWATQYIGRTDMHCWGLIRSVYNEHCGILLPEYAEVDSQELEAVAAAVREGRSHTPTWLTVAKFPGEESPFDVVVMTGWLKTGDGTPQRGVVHTGVVTRKGHVMHTDMGYAVVEVPLSHQTIRRRLVGCYRHFLNGGYVAGP